MADPKFVATTLGLAVASQATPVGPFIHITGFRVGSAFGYEPTPADTGLNGALLYSGVPLSYEYVGDNTINVLCRIDARAGPFDFGEVCVDLDGGIMFAKAVFEEPQKKYTSLNTNVQSTYTFNCLLKLQQSVAVFRIDTFGSPPDIWKVDAWSDVYPPALSANPGIPAILVQELDAHGNSSLIHRASDTHWTVGTNYELMYWGNARVLTTDGVVINDSDLKLALPYVPLSDYTTNEQRAYVVETPDGYLRSVFACGPNASIPGTHSFNFNGSMLGNLSTSGVSIYTNRKALMTGARLSADANNLIELRDDGLYYGTEAPDAIKYMYVDSVSGLDTNIGSRAAPVRTIKEALRRGTRGINRYLYLREQQTFIVDPADPIAFRGGSWYVAPYGPLCDALPPVPGDSPLYQTAAQALAPVIQSLPRINTVPDGSGAIFQKGLALYPDNAKVEPICVNFVCAAPNGSSYPESANGPTFQDYQLGGQWILANSSVDFNNGRFAGLALAPFTITLRAVGLFGTGYLAEAATQDMAITYFSSGFGVNNTTPDQVMAAVQNAVTSERVYSNVSTNIVPPAPTVGGNLERINVALNYTIPADRIGYYRLCRYETSNVGTARMYLNGNLIIIVDVKDDGNSGMYTIALNPGDNIRVDGAVGTPGNTYAQVDLYPEGITSWK